LRNNDIRKNGEVLSFVDRIRIINIHDFDEFETLILSIGNIMSYMLYIDKDKVVAKKIPCEKHAKISDSQLLDYLLNTLNKKKTNLIQEYIRYIKEKNNADK